MAHSKKREKVKVKAKIQDGQKFTQTSSRLLQLPRELRDQIYTRLFTSTRITFGRRPTSYTKSKATTPTPNNLAILYSCGQVNYEAGLLWLRHVLFSFERLEDLLDKLSPLPTTTLSQIRHIRTGFGSFLMIQPIDDDGDVFYRLAWVLKLLPALRLDRLTVLGSPHGEYNYGNVEDLIKYGNGWKEMHYVTKKSEMLSFSQVNVLGEPLYRREPQPSVWSKMLLQRDGPQSGASVSICRAIQLDAPIAIFNPLTRQAFKQKVSSQEDLERFGVEEDDALLNIHEIGKELLVVVKRGRTVDIEERDRPPYLRGDIRRWTRGLTWTEIRRQCGAEIW